MTSSSPNADDAAGSCSMVDTAYACDSVGRLTTSLQNTRSRPVKGVFCQSVFALLSRDNRTHAVLCKCSGLCPLALRRVSRHASQLLLVAGQTTGYSSWPN